MLLRALQLVAPLSLLVVAQSSGPAYISHQDTFLLPRPFQNNITRPFVDTEVANGLLNKTIAAAKKAAFISYDREFGSIIGTSPEIRLLASSDRSFAFEAGVWVPETQQVWFTAFLDPPPGVLTILNLNDSTTYEPRLSGPGAAVFVNPNGGYYFQGRVYITTFGNETTTPTILSIDPYTFESHEVVNSFFGTPLNGPDDVTFAVSKVTGKPCMFFTDFLLAVEGLSGTWPGPQQLPFSVWRLIPSEQSLTTAISPLDVQVPNGLAVDRTNSYLYVSDGPDSAVFGTGYNVSSGSPGIYQFDLGGSDGCTPLNKRLLGYARQGFANGIKIDDHGRIWTAEYEGVVVRSPTGKVLGLFNALSFLKNSNVSGVAPIANFALAGDHLIFLAFDCVYGVKLAEVIMTPR